MADVFTCAKRSAVMAAIQGAGNKDTELRLIAIFRAGRIGGWRRGWPLPGKPDFTFPRERVVVFVDGCFWHGCPQHYRRPKSRQGYWDAKIARNRARDRTVDRELRGRGVDGGAPVGACPRAAEGRSGGEAVAAGAGSLRG